MYTDRAISCLDCGQEFTFTAGEQEFYSQRGFTEPPKRCAACRSVRKAQRNASSGYGSSEGYGDIGGPAGYSNGYAERRPRQMHESTCADCGKTAFLPFEPTGARPVYCSDCFQRRRA